MKRCKKCGWVGADNSKYCRTCGKRIWSIDIYKIVMFSYAIVAALIVIIGVYVKLK